VPKAFVTLIKIGSGSKFMELNVNRKFINLKNRKKERKLISEK